MRLLWVFGAILFSFQQAFATTAGFIKSPMSQTKLVGDGAVMHCDVIGSPIPEVQWWFIEGIEPNETASQLFEGAQHDRVRINTTYIQHGASTLLLYNLTFNDTGVYECRASNDPDRNSLRTLPKVKWIRSQANVIVIERPVIVGKPSDFNNQTSATLSCNLTNPGSVVKGHHWEKNNKIIGGTKKDGSELYIEYTISKIEGNSGIYTCVFDSEPQARKDIPVTGALHVLAHKHSENANENDKVVLVCDCHSYPLVTDWTWKKVEESGKEPRTIVNGTDRFTIKSTPNNSTLTIEDLINEDGGEYECWAENMNATGKVSSAKIHLRVRSRLAALWPFLGIVVEVIILITIIFIYEKRRKPDEINDDDDSGSAPLKSNSATNHKDKNVRQRNSN